MKKSLNILLVALLATSLTSFLSSCEEEADCSMVGRNMLRCNLYTIQAETNTAQSTTLDSITVTADKTDSVLVNNQKQVKDLLLPLRYTADSTLFVLRYQKAEWACDTLVVYHSNTPYFVSMDCGYEMKQVITGLRHTRRLLDSVYVSNPEAKPITYGTENIQLFY